MQADIEVDFLPQEVKEKIADKIQNKVQLALNEQIIKDSNVYCPEDTGTLQSSVVMGLGDDAFVEWNEPYAYRQYHGDENGFNYSKDNNINARGHWFEAAKAEHVKDWEALCNERLKK